MLKAMDNDVPDNIASYPVVACVAPSFGSGVGHMSENDVRGPPNDGRAPPDVSSEMAALAAELNALTDQMEAEWNERRTVSSENAQRLSELRAKFVQLVNG